MIRCVKNMKNNSFSLNNYHLTDIMKEKYFIPNSNEILSWDIFCEEISWSTLRKLKKFTRKQEKFSWVQA